MEIYRRKYEKDDLSEGELEEDENSNDTVGVAEVVER